MSTVSIYFINLNYFVNYESMLKLIRGTFKTDLRNYDECLNSENGEFHKNEGKLKNLLPWAKNTWCESQWFGGDWGRSDLVPWSASSTPSNHTTSVMHPGTTTLWARQTQGALFLEVRKSAKTTAKHSKLDLFNPKESKNLY